MAGADGLITEVHETPEEAFSDGQQNLNYTEAEAFYARARATFALRQSF
jgi:3-deoxy-7-phosphoheptulonate synthase